MGTSLQPSGLVATAVMTATMMEPETSDVAGFTVVHVVYGIVLGALLGLGILVRGGDPRAVARLRAARRWRS